VATRVITEFTGRIACTAMYASARTRADLGATPSTLRFSSEPSALRRCLPIGGRGKSKRCTSFRDGIDLERIECQSSAFAYVRILEKTVYIIFLRRRFERQKLSIRYFARLVFDFQTDSSLVNGEIARRQPRPNPINQFEGSFRESRCGAIKGQD